MRVSAHLSVLILLLCCRPASAALVGVKFTGVSLQPAVLFGTTTPAFAPFSGHVIYDSEAEATHTPSNCSGCVGWQQDRVNGLFVQIGETSVRADSYVAAVFSDEQVITTGQLVDRLSIDFNLEFSPPLPSSLFVDGAAIQLGNLGLNLIAPAGAFVDGELPSGPALDELLPSLSTLGAGDSGAADPLFLGVLRTIERFAVVLGDYDQDGAVSALDYAAWASSYGGSKKLFADGNGDGFVDAADYTVWRDQLGVAGTRAVPEPAALMCLWISVGAVAGFPCSRARHR